MTDNELVILLNGLISSYLAIEGIYNKKEYLGEIKEKIDSATREFRNFCRRYGLDNGVCDDILTKIVKNIAYTTNSTSINLKTLETLLKGIDEVYNYLKTSFLENIKNMYQELDRILTSANGEIILCAEIQNQIICTRSMKRPICFDNYNRPYFPTEIVIYYNVPGINTYVNLLNDIINKAIAKNYIHIEDLKKIGIGFEEFGRGGKQVVIHFPNILPKIEEKMAGLGIKVHISTRPLEYIGQLVENV